MDCGIGRYIQFIEWTIHAPVVLAVQRYLNHFWIVRQQRFSAPHRIKADLRIQSQQLVQRHSTAATARAAGSKAQHCSDGSCMVQQLVQRHSTAATARAADAKAQHCSDGSCMVI